MVSGGNMKRTVFISLLLVVSLLLFANNKDVYLTLLNDNKLDELQVHLESWQKQDPENPELYIAYFNYHLHKGTKSGISIDNYRKDETKETLSISDPKTGKIIGYLNDKLFFDFEEIKTALKYLDEGLKFGPDRLDMYFGKIKTFESIGDYGNQSKQLIETLQHGIQIDNKWLWSDNETIEDGESVLLNSADDYYGFWFSVKTDASLEAAYKSALEQIKLFPNHNYAYNNMGTYYAIKKQYLEAITYYCKAENLEPKDTIVLSNIARCYEEIKDTEKAIVYYNKLKKYGNKNEIDYANKKLKKLIQ